MESAIGMGEYGALALVVGAVMAVIQLLGRLVDTLFSKRNGKDGSTGFTVQDRDFMHSIQSSVDDTRKLLEIHREFGWQPIIKEMLDLLRTMNVTMASFNLTLDKMTDLLGETKGMVVKHCEQAESLTEKMMKQHDEATRRFKGE